jgi:torulene dioxygenase
LARVATYAAPNFLFFHSVNAYDYIDQGTGFKNVHVDLISYDGASCPFLEFNFSNLLSPGGPFTDGTLIRYELSGVNALPKFSETQRRATVAQMMPNCPIELPRINKFYSCNPSYRYVWGIIESGGTAPGTLVPLAKLSNGISHPSCAFSAGIAKADWQTGKVEIWRPENGESAPCEPVFIGRPGASDEDDGITLTIVVNREGSHSTLVALDGKTLAEVARAPMPQVYGMGPHGSFIEKPGLYSQADMNP